MSTLDRASRIEERLLAACIAHGLDYDLGRGKRIPIPLVPVPFALSASWLREAHALSEAINRHLCAMPAAWMRDEELRRVLPFADTERRFVESVWRDGHASRQTVVSRNDFDMPEDPSHSVAFEANGCAIGGLWYGGAAARAGSQVLVPDLRRAGAATIIDGYEVFLASLRSHARRVGLREVRRIGILEDRDWEAGITEMPSIATRLRHDGLVAVLGDPRALAVRRGGFELAGEPVDLLYRNMEIADLTAIEAEQGGKLRAMREAFRENVVVSTVAGDFDQKALWEVLTSRRFERHVAKADRVRLRKHLLWTRLLRDVETEGPDGSVVSLVDFALASRRRLVLKPNLLCGGEGVTLGPLLSPEQWERAVRRALRQPGQWVLQRFHRASKVRFAGVGARYITCGVISSPSLIGALGRASTDPVVNVSRGGGLVPLYRRLAATPGRGPLRGPGYSAPR